MRCHSTCGIAARIFFDPFDRSGSACVLDTDEKVWNTITKSWKLMIHEVFLTICRRQLSFVFVKKGFKVSEKRHLAVHHSAEGIHGNVRKRYSETAAGRRALVWRVVLHFNTEGKVC